MKYITNLIFFLRGVPTRFSWRAFILKVGAAGGHHAAVAIFNCLTS